MKSIHFTMFYTAVDAKGCDELYVRVEGILPPTSRK